MSKKIIRIEDITNIVGIKNYIECLSLDQKNLTYLGYKIESNVVTLNFKYEEENIQVKIDKDYNIKTLKCDCEDFDQDYCKHVGFVIMYIMQNEDMLSDLINEMNNTYDEKFNDILFSLLNNNNINKRRLNLEVILKPTYNEKVELQLKIGEDKTYVLKKHIRNFLDAYNERLEEVEFGINFTYNPEIHYFSEIDNKIIKFVNIYMDSQNNERNYYGYYNSNDIILSNYSLKEFLKLLDNKDFIIENGYYKQYFNGINRNYNLDLDLKNNSNSITLEIENENIIPFISDYSYVIKDKQMIYFDEETRRILQILFSSNRNKIIFKEQDYSNFANIILPKLKKLNSNLVLKDEIKEKFKFEDPKVKYYFEKDKDTIIGYIKLFLNDLEVNIINDDNNFNGIYIVRDREKENIYINELYDLGFKLEKDRFIIYNENDIIKFIESGLNYISSKYETYVSKNLKDIKFIKNITMTNNFSIGSDNILNYSFNVDNIDKKEIGKLIDAVKEKKKYYRMKNGDYVSLDQNKEMENLVNLVDSLDISTKDLMDDIKLPKYKSMQLLDNEFVKLDDSVKTLLDDFNKYKNLKVNFDKESKDILRDYQKTGIKWMLTISKCGFGGILADEMGLGKSLQTITYIKMKLKEKGKFLIIVPTSLIYNWENEFKKFAPDIKYLIVNDIKAKRVELLKEIDHYDVIITTYGLLRQDIELYQDYSFNTCIIDEAQNIKNVNAETTKCVKMIKADTKFALTGTPIENSILELWSIFDYIMPGFLSHLAKFKRDYSIKNIEEDSDLLDNLNKMISPFIMRRKKKDVLKDLPDKIENNVIIELSDEQKKIYMAELEKTKEEIDKTIRKEGFLKSQILILSLLTKLRQICIDPRLIFENYNEVGSKFENLIDILKQVIDNGHKVLLFSQFPSALRLLIPMLNENNVKYYYLDGSTKSKMRMELVDKFNNDDTNVFLISLKAGGTGLNLTSADIVIHLDPWWNPQVENQATDRAHRIGQKNVVEVVKLVAKGTIEEKIIELQNKKKELSDKIIEGDNRDQIVLSKLTEEDIKGLLM